MTISDNERKSDLEENAHESRVRLRRTTVTQFSCANLTFGWLKRIINLLLVMTIEGNKTGAMFPRTPPLVMSCQPLPRPWLCFPIMASLPPAWFKQAVFFFCLSIIPCPAAARCLTPHQPGLELREWEEWLNLVFGVGVWFSSCVLALSMVCF